MPYPEWLDLCVEPEEIGLTQMHEQMSKEIARACGLTREEHARLIHTKQCGSCGAYQVIRGDLPCGH